MLEGAPESKAVAMPELSIVVPVFNELAVLGELQRRLDTVLAICAPHHEILYVDDGSSDESAAILLAFTSVNSRVRVLRLSRNFGHQAAVTAALSTRAAGRLSSLTRTSRTRQRSFPTSSQSGALASRWCRRSGRPGRASLRSA